MTPITRVLTAIKEGDPQAASQLLPLVYAELRQLARRRMAEAASGQSFQGTDLVHEAYLRLVGAKNVQHWNGRGHFFAAAAEAMRRILVEHARRKHALRRGGDRRRQDVDWAEKAAPQVPDDLLALSEALDELAKIDGVKAELVKLRYFAGLTMEQTAEVLGISSATAHRYWNYARAWLHQQISGDRDRPEISTNS